jgi:hypothetical protein
MTVTTLPSFTSLRCEFFVSVRETLLPKLGEAVKVLQRDRGIFGGNC